MEREVPSAVKQLLIGLIDETGAAVSLDVVKGKFILIYFGAQWSVPSSYFLKIINFIIYINFMRFSGCEVPLDDPRILGKCFLESSL